MSDIPISEDKTPRLRKDARLNLDKLYVAAMAAFQEFGLEVPLKEIASRAGVSTGTLYNRFGSREALIDAVVSKVASARLEAAVNRARSAVDPWQRFERYLWELGELQAETPMLNDIFSHAYPQAKQLAAVCEQSMSQAQRFIEEAQADGSLRSDLVQDDFFIILWTNACLLRATTGKASGSWRRRMALIIDGLRASAAHPLPAEATIAEAKRKAVPRSRPLRP